MSRLSYVAITPARDEAENLARVGACLAAQTVRPTEWVIVDNGSVDGTREVALDLVARHPWIRLLAVRGERSPVRGGPIVRAFVTGLGSLETLPDVVVKLDADLTMEPDYFERLLAAFEADPALGIASGTCWEIQDGEWRPQYSTRDHVRGAARAYRRECLGQVLPLPERMGWDGIDELKAKTCGWRTRSIQDLPIRHHRTLGGREPRVPMWIAQGEMAHFMCYRPSYLLARALYNAGLGRDPTALAMLVGYTRAALARQPRYEDPAVRTLLREEQSARRLPRRLREALGRVPASS
jgi:glycosyltransferase involved in cell wall biosynthesis